MRERDLLFELLSPTTNILIFCELVSMVIKMSRHIGASQTRLHILPWISQYLSYFAYFFDMETGKLTSEIAMGPSINVMGPNRPREQSDSVVFGFGGLHRPTYNTQDQSSSYDRSDNSATSREAAQNQISLGLVEKISSWWVSAALEGSGEESSDTDWEGEREKEGEEEWQRAPLRVREEEKERRDF